MVKMPETSRSPGLSAIEFAASRIALGRARQTAQVTNQTTPKNFPRKRVRGDISLSSHALDVLLYGEKIAEAQS